MALSLYNVKIKALFKQMTRDSVGVWQLLLQYKIILYLHVDNDFADGLHENYYLTPTQFVNSGILLINLFGSSNCTLIRQSDKYSVIVKYKVDKIIYVWDGKVKA